MPNVGAWIRSGWSRRSWMMSIAFAEISIPIQRRPRFCAATTDVPQPQNGSRTRSPGLLDALMIRSSSATGFCVGYPRRSAFRRPTGDIPSRSSSQ